MTAAAEDVCIRNNRTGHCFNQDIAIRCYTVGVHTTFNRDRSIERCQHQRRIT